MLKLQFLLLLPLLGGAATGAPAAVVNMTLKF